jgi:predicted ATP-dependent protease
MSMTHQTLPPEALRLTLDPGVFSFTDTSELLHLPLPWIGQERAEAAARFGLAMQQPGYNLFVLGEVGSGRTTLLTQLMREQAAGCSVPPDLCYLHNFDAPERPHALRLPAGEGRLLRQLMGQFAKHLQSDIPTLLRAPEYKSAAEQIEASAKSSEAQAYAALSSFAQERHFVLLREQGNLVFTLKDAQDEPVTAGKALAYSPEQRQQIDTDGRALQAKIEHYLADTAEIRRSCNDALGALRGQAVKPLLDHLLQDIRSALRKRIKDTLKLGNYLDCIAQEVQDNLALFEPTDDEEARLDALIEVLSHFRVNLVVDNHDLRGAPVLVEDNPQFHALFGGIEYASSERLLETDFSHIRAGSLLKAHGGFLLLHLRDLLADEPVWEKLRRFLRSGRLQIEEPGMVLAAMAAVTLAPEPVAVDVKIVLIASVDEYYAVQEGDSEFARRFLCKVDFSDSFRSTPQTSQATAVFVAHTCQRLGLPHFSAAAVAALIEHGHRQADDQTRQSAQFARLETLAVEAGAVAQPRGTAARVQATDVQAAVQAQVQRHNAPEERLQQTITDGERLLEVRGHKLAQINGLTVIDLGDYQFGFPVRVTAHTYAGEEGLINIEREVELSGPIHDKGVLILHSYLSSLFAHVAPLAMNASVVFEQEYNGVEGDSASCAEFFALLSSLSGLPLRQGIAVTGALNQHGEILPVGGINEKIEGYFKSCELLGLDGSQGVLIPSRNRRHLMLDARVVDAVAKGRFHIYTAELASQGMELLTGVRFGSLEVGGYGADTVLGQAQKTLQKYRLACDGPEPHQNERRQRRLSANRSYRP